MRSSRLATKELLLALSIVLASLLPAAAEPTTARIINGHPSDPGDWPWMVSLSRSSSTPARSHFCGGILIHPRYVLTAAHCVWELQETPGEIRALIGANRLSAEDGIEASVDGVILHPDFTNELVYNDIALLRLSEPVTVQTITPVTSGEEDDWSAGTYLSLIGWGVLDPVFPARPDVLQRASVPRIGDEECRSRIGLDFDPATMLCAGQLASSPIAEDGIDACYGDSGGPLMVPTARGWRLVGIVSWGFGCGDDKFWGVYTRVASYSDWLESLPGVPPYPLDGPLVEGAPRVGKTLTCVPGGWGGDPTTSFSFEWRDDLTGVLEGENTATYTLRRRDIGTRLSCIVTAHNRAGSATAESGQVGPIFPKKHVRLSRRASAEIAEANLHCDGSHCDLLVSTLTPVVASVDVLPTSQGRCSARRRKRCVVRAAAWQSGTRVTSGNFIVPIGRRGSGRTTFYLRVRYEEGPPGRPFPIRIDKG